MDRGGALHPLQQRTELIRIRHGNATRLSRRSGRQQRPTIEGSSVVMGCFDSVYFTCPNCGAQIEAQSKGGECQLDTYPPDAVPARVAMDLTIWNRCKCGKAYRI